MVLNVMAWERAILHIDEMNMSRLAQRLNMTYSHLTKIVKEMKKKKWITITKKGRINIIMLTEKGKEMQTACRTITNALKIRVLFR